MRWQDIKSLHHIQFFKSSELNWIKAVAGDMKLFRDSLERDENLFR